MNEDPKAMDREMGRDPLKDAGDAGGSYWWARGFSRGWFARGEATDFGWGGAIIGLLFLVVFVAIAAIVLWLYRDVPAR